MKTRIRQLTEQEKRSLGEQQMIADWLKIFPKGILSIVADTFDLWKLITEYLPANKEAIMARDGKLVIRPDSGNPVDIICGLNYTILEDELNSTPFKTYLPYDGRFNHGDYYTGEQDYTEDENGVLNRGVEFFKFKGKYYKYNGEDTVNECEEIKNFNENSIKGVIELLWDIFGGTVNRGAEILSDKEYAERFLKIKTENLPDFIKEALFNEIQSGGNESWIVRYDKNSNKQIVFEIRNCLEELYPEIFPEVKKYKVLDPHIGAIYGDSITPERQRQIYERLAAKGFAATNIVLGVGSFTYQYNTRDTLGFAAKGAWFEVQTYEDFKDDIEPELGTRIFSKKSYNIYKDPVTDDGTKKSLKGLLTVYKLHDYPNTKDYGELHFADNDYVVKQECTPEEESQGLLQVIYEDGKFYNQTTLNEVRERLLK